MGREHSIANSRILAISIPPRKVTIYSYARLMGSSQKLTPLFISNSIPIEPTDYYPNFHLR